MHYFGIPHQKKMNAALKEWHAADPVNRIIPTKKDAASTDNLNPGDVDMTYCHVCLIP